MAPELWFSSLPTPFLLAVLLSLGQPEKGELFLDSWLWLSLSRCRLSLGLHSACKDFIFPKGGGAECSITPGRGQN